jgi:dGTPase
MRLRPGTWSEQLYAHFLAHPEQLPTRVYPRCPVGKMERAACDYIAGMTDRFAKVEFLRHFFPSVLW